MKLKQIVWQLWYRFYCPRYRKLSFEALRPQTSSWVASIKKKRCLNLKDESFYFAGVSQPIQGVYDLQIDKKTNKLWHYHLQYMDYIDSSDLTDSLKQQLILGWIEKNPPTSCISWDPYPISRRVVNWIKWLVEFKIENETICNSLCSQVDFLSRRLEYHILGNHLFANAKALIFAGMFFEFDLADKWLAKGLKIFKNELKKQFLEDGAHFELSPMYHSIMLEDILDIVNIMTVYGVDSKGYISQKSIAAKLSWLKYMSHPDGDISFFNDSMFNMSANYEGLADYASRLGFSNKGLEVNHDTSGYIKLVNNKVTLIADVAKIGPDYLPGHAHADTLSFECSINGDRVLVNSGVSTYDISEQRLYDRGTSSHNTLIVNGSNSSQVWSSFRVAKRAAVKNIKISRSGRQSTVSAEHNGYYANFGTIHKRTWRLRSSCLGIFDEIRGSNTHDITVFFHFHPEVNVIKIVNSSFSLVRNEVEIARICIDSKLNVELEQFDFHPELGVNLKAYRLVCSAKLALPDKLVHKITLK